VGLDPGDIGNCNVTSENKDTWELFQGFRTRQQSKLFQSLNLLCYTRERVKTEDNEIQQHQTISLYIHFICHLWILPHALINHPNLSFWSYTPLTHLISVQPRHIARCRNTSNHFLLTVHFPSPLRLHLCMTVKCPVVSAFTYVNTYVYVSPHRKVYL